MKNALIEKHLIELCTKNPEGTECVIQFLTGAVAGAIRIADSQPNELTLFELLAPSMLGGPGQAPRQVLVSNYFTVESVERVMIPKDMPTVIPVGSRIVAPGS